MRSFIPLLLAALLSARSNTLLAQTSKLDDNAPLARISYKNSFLTDWDEPASPRVCFALYDGGYYQLLRLRKDGSEQALHGTLPTRQVAQFRKLIKDFEVNSASAGGVRNGAESLVVDVVNDGGTQRHQWLNPDRRNPFPASAAKIAAWLQNFRAKDAEEFTARELSDQKICPPGSLKPLQPTLAESRAQ